MVTAIFGISNDGLNLVVNLLILMLIVVWLALIVYTYFDAKRRINDPFLIGCATLASFIPYLGTAVYAIVRPPEFLEDAHERELEIKAAELRVARLTEQSCPGCEYPVEKDYLRCPQCQRRLKDPCPSCGRPVDPRWALCPFCEETLSGRPERERERPRRKRAETRRPATEERKPPKEERKSPKEERKSPKEERKVAKPKAEQQERKEPPARREADTKEPPKKQKRSASREPDPDPRKA